jgi:hypothetical protein
MKEVEVTACGERVRFRLWSLSRRGTAGRAKACIAVGISIDRRCRHLRCGEVMGGGRRNGEGFNDSVRSCAEIKSRCRSIQFFLWVYSVNFLPLNHVPWSALASNQGLCAADGTRRGRRTYRGRHLHRPPLEVMGGGRRNKEGFSGSVRICAEI